MELSGRGEKLSGNLRKLGSLLYRPILFFETSRAQTTEYQLMGIHPQGIPFRQSLEQFPGKLILAYIQNRTALGTDKVVMRMGISIKTFLPVDYTQAGDEPFFLELCQIPIHGSQAQIGILGLYCMIHPFSSGVAIGATNRLQNRLSLSAEIFALHGDLLSSNLKIRIILVCVYSIRFSIRCQEKN